MMFGWYEPEAEGFRLFMIRFGTACALLGLAGLAFVAVVVLYGMFAA